MSNCHIYIYIYIYICATAGIDDKLRHNGTLTDGKCEKSQYGNQNYVHVCGYVKRIRTPKPMLYTPASPHSIALVVNVRQQDGRA